MLTAIKTNIIRASFLLNVLFVAGVVIFVYGANVKLSGHITAGNDAFAKSISQEDARVDASKVMVDPTVNAAEQPAHIPAHKPKVK